MPALIIGKPGSYVGQAKVGGLELVLLPTQLADVSDTMTRVWTAFKTLSETADVNDVFSAQFSTSKSDAIDVNDVPSKTIGPVKSETLNVKSNEITSKVIRPTKLETIQSNETISKAMGTVKSDTADVSDFFSYELTTISLSTFTFVLTRGT